MTFDRRWRHAALAGIFLTASFGTIGSTARAQDFPAGCAEAGTPAAVESEADATATPADIDANLAWTYLQANLAEGVLEFATLAGEGVVADELASVLLQQGLDAQSDIDALQPLLPEGEPIGLESLLAVADETRQELDMPAGQGGSVAFGAAPWITTLCSADGLSDTIIANASIDLSQQQIDLAQIAVAAGNPESQAFGTTIIDRESARISLVLTFLANASPMASPDATPGG